jgi:hypothetical protein
MFNALIVFLMILLGRPLLAERYVPDSDVHNYESTQPKKQRVDVYDFEGTYPELEHIHIDAKRKKNVVFHLTGEYPALARVNYEGSFGVLSGELTGVFPQLEMINFLCSNCAIDLDLTAQWSRCCEINIRGVDEDIVLILPKDVGLEISTKVALKGKVLPCEGLKKKGRLGILKKTYVNDLLETSPIVLKINIELAEGHIILK